MSQSRLATITPVPGVGACRSAAIKFPFLTLIFSSKPPSHHISKSLKSASPHFSSTLFKPRHYFPRRLPTMCDYTQVEFRCGHVRYTVRAWCTNYETTHKRCPPSVVAIEFRYVETYSRYPLHLTRNTDWTNAAVIAVPQQSTHHG
jgi:hypothetical protein